MTKEGILYTEFKKLLLIMTIELRPLSSFVLVADTSSFSDAVFPIRDQCYSYHISQYAGVTNVE